jgi:hypothetical protein
MIPLLAAVADEPVDALWTPAEITTHLWLDAADGSTITVDSSTVQTWNDKSGQANHASRLGIATAPTVLNAELNGKNVLDFADRYLQGASFSHSQISIFAVRQFSNPTGLGTTKSVMFDDGDDLSFGSSAGARFDNFSGTARLGVRSGFVTAASTSTAWHIQEGVYNGSNRILYIDGTQIASDAATGDTSPTATKFTIARFQTSSAGALDSSDSDMKLAELVLIAGGATTDQRQKIEGYLAHKWALQSQLPVAHPYKDDPPYLA